MGNEDERNVTQLESERNIIAARIKSGGLSESEAERLIEQHEALDWRIAQSAANDLAELEIKILRLHALIHPYDGPMPADFLEHAMILGVISDVRQLKP